MVETPAAAAYSFRMEDPIAEAPIPSGWLESLRRSKAQIAAGEAVPLLPLLDRLRAAAERLEAEQGIADDGEGTHARR